VISCGSVTQTSINPRTPLRDPEFPKSKSRMKSWAVQIPAQNRFLLLIRLFQQTTIFWVKLKCRPRSLALS